MSNEYQIKGQVSATKVKQNLRRPKVDYTPVYNEIEKLSPGKALVIEVKSQLQCNTLRKAVHRYSDKFQCLQKRVESGYEFYITRKEDIS